MERSIRVWVLRRSPLIVLGSPGLAPPTSSQLGGGCSFFVFIPWPSDVDFRCLWDETFFRPRGERMFALGFLPSQDDVSREMPRWAARLDELDVSMSLIASEPDVAVSRDWFQPYMATATGWRPVGDANPLEYRAREHGVETLAKAVASCRRVAVSNLRFSMLVRLCGCLAIDFSGRADERCPLYHVPFRGDWDFLRKLTIQNPKANPEWIRAVALEYCKTHRRRLLDRIAEGYKQAGLKDDPDLDLSILFQRDFPTPLLGFVRDWSQVPGGGSRRNRALLDVLESWRGEPSQYAELGSPHLSVAPGQPRWFPRPWEQLDPFL